MFDKAKKWFNNWKNSYKEVTIPAKDNTLISPEVPQNWTPPKPQLAQNLQPTIARSQPTPQPVIQQAPEPTPRLARNPSISKFNITPQVDTAIRGQAKNYNINPEILGDVALQESSFNPTADAYTSGYDGKTIDPKTGKPRDLSTSKGLFMFNDEAWGPTRAYFQSNPESNLRMPSEDRFDPEANTAYAAYLISHGQLGRWYPSAAVWAPNYTWEELQPYLTQTKDQNALDIIKYYAKK